MSKSMFIVFEGGEGTGKTTQAELIGKKLSEMTGLEVVITREPGGVSYCEDIRKIIMDNKLNYRTEALLFAASRASLVEEVIRPALLAGKIVICDRYVYSSIVYQGIVRGLGVNEVLKLNEWATDFLVADKVYFFDIDPRVALSRINQKSREVNRFDEEKFEFHQKVYEGYKKVLSDNSAVINVDASCAINDISDFILKDVLKSLNG